MDNLVLIRVAAALDDELRATVLEDVRKDGLHRYRLAFRKADRRRSVLVSLRPELPWIGSPAVRRKGKAARRGDAFEATCRRALAGTVVESVGKPSSDRVVVIRFADGHALVAELATHGANLILLGREGVVDAAARNPRAARERIAPGGKWKPRSLPPRQLDPFGAEAHTIGEVLEQAVRDDEPLLEAIRRRLFGVGTEGARLVSEESNDRGVPAGQVLAERLEQLAAGELDPVILTEGDPVELARQGRLDPGAVRLLPWDPGGEIPSIRRRDPAATAGLYHEALELSAEIVERIEALRAILAKEVRRLWEVETRVSADLRGFEDPDRYRRWAEALLAGLAAAERHGEHVVVPDPWEPESSVIVPATPGMSLPAVADAHFRRHRRAKRGLESARRRLDLVRSRRERLERLATETEDAAGEDGSTRIEEGMRHEGIAVGLFPRRRSEGPGGIPARVEGVRMFTSTDGASILVGRTGRANDRLTFKIAGPEDFWLHAQGHPGAHVVIRNPRRLTQPSTAALEEAAALAAWYSGARSEGQVDVHWTRRKYVRRVRGAPTGTVTLKRFSIVRVRPEAPATREDPS
jgi:predicted ribosome quality control (RQC) complex YloA/Tae2 family protein